MMVTTETVGNRSVSCLTYDGMADMVDAALGRHRGHADTMAHYGRSFTHVSGMDEVETLVRDGWADEMPGALNIAESAVSTVERRYEMTRPVAMFDVTGQDVDVALFLDGEPECMIDYPLREVVDAGRVITLCASIATSAAVSTEAMIRRGSAVVALALALDRCGYGVEIFLDWSNTTMGGPRNKPTESMRVPIKLANDHLDAERILFALAHPAMLRVLAFAAADDYPQDVRDAHGNTEHGWQGIPSDPHENMPEGTIYLPAVCSDCDVPDAERFVIDKLRKLGIIED